MINIGYRAARAQGYWVRSIYSRMIPRIVRRPVRQTKRVPVSVYSFSCEHLLPEQISSIRSFIQHVGVPESFTVLSDGSYSASSALILKQVHDCVRVLDWAEIVGSLPDCVRAFAEQHPMGKKLAILFSLPVKNATIYTDCDVLFFPNSDELIKIVESSSGHHWYLPDCLQSLDMSLLRDESERLNPVNAGFMILKERLAWGDPLKRFAKYQGSPLAVTEQTLVHLAMHQNHATPLCPDKFILRVEDEFIYRDLYADKEIVLRHYVNNVRHKFWQSVSLRTFQN